MSIFSKLEKLGCKDPMDINYAFPWIQGRLSAYGISTSKDDDPEDLVDYIMATAGESPHRDKSLVKRPKNNESDKSGKIDISEDEGWNKRILFLCNRFIDVDFEINFKKRGFRVFTSINNVKETLINVDAIRQLDSGEIKCTATLKQIDDIELIELDDSIKAPKIKEDKPISFTSVNLINFLNWYQRCASEVSYELAEDHANLVNQKFQKRK